MEDNMELVHGRPQDAAGRLDKEIRVYDLLDRLGIAFQRVDHAAAMTMEDCAEVDQVLGTIICKNLFLCNRQKTQFYLLMMPADKPFHTKDITSQIGSARLSFATPDYMEQFLDITPGSVSILGLMNDTENRVQLLIDKPVVECEKLACHPCINTASILMDTRDVMENFLPAVHHKAIIVDLPDDRK